MATNKQRFNKKYGFKRDEGHTIEEIAKIANAPKKILEDVYLRGVGARRNNPASVRSTKDGKKRGGTSLAGKMSAEQWGMARIYGFVMDNPKQVDKGKPDRDLYEKWKKKK